MDLYADSDFPVDARFAGLDADELASFARPGTWLTAAERTAVAALAREVRCEAGTQASVGDESLAEGAPLSAPVRELVRRSALGGIDIDRAFFDASMAAGVPDTVWVEAVAICARSARLDVFARGIGVPPRPLAAPDDTGEPSRQRPAEAIDEGFFTASVPSGRRGGELGQSLYGPGQMPNILRSLSLVPEEARRLIHVMDETYLPPGQIMDFGYSPYPDLTRPQLELVAARVSALNQCFY